MSTEERTIRPFSVGGLAAATFGVAGLLAGVAAWLSWRASGLAVGLAGMIGAWLAAPGALLGTLLAAVLWQDALVAWGLARAQQLDEILVITGCLSGIVGAALGSRLQRTSFDTPLLAFGAAGALGAVARDVPLVVASLGMLAVLKGLLSAQLGARSPVSSSAVARGAWLLLALASALAAIGVAQRIGGRPVYVLTGQLDYYLAFWQGGKAPSLFAHHNALGHVCVLAGALAIGMMLNTPGSARRTRLGLAAVASLCLAGLLASASRESWLAASASLTLVAAYTRSRRLWKVAIVTAVLLVVGGFMVYLGSPLLREEVARRGAGVIDGWRDYRLGFTGWAFRGEYRVYVILKSLDIVLDHPLLGTGPGRYGGHVASLYLSPVYEEHGVLPLDGVYQPLDVFWSRLLTEFGLLGSSAYVWAMAVAAQAHVAASRAHDHVARGVGVGGLMAFTGVVVIGFFSPALEDPLVAIPFWVWAGLSWQMSRGSGDSGASGDSGRDSPSRPRVPSPQSESAYEV
jgi:hypothetical protein